MKLKDKKTDVKLGDLVIGTTATGEVVVGPVVSLNENKKTLVVGSFQMQSNSAPAERCVLVKEI